MAAPVQSATPEFFDNAVYVVPYSVFTDIVLYLPKMFVALVCETTAFPVRGLAGAKHFQFPSPLPESALKEEYSRAGIFSTE